MDQLAMALGQVIPAERGALYVRALSDLSEARLAYGFECALKFFKPEFGRTFPAPADIREWANQWRPEIDESRAILQRPAKPEDWIPLAELQKELQAAARVCSFPEGAKMTADEQDRRIATLRSQAEELRKTGKELGPITGGESA